MSSAHPIPCAPKLEGACVFCKQGCQSGLNPCVSNLLTKHRQGQVTGCALASVRPFCLGHFFCFVRLSRLSPGSASVTTANMEYDPDGTHELLIEPTQELLGAGCRSKSVGFRMLSLGKDGEPHTSPALGSQVLFLLFPWPVDYLGLSGRGMADWHVLVADLPPSLDR